MSIAFATAALVIIMSVYNGFEKIIMSYYNKYNPDLVILPKEAKYINADSVFITNIKSVPNVEDISKQIKENCLVEFNRKQHVAEIVGVDQNYSKVAQIDSLLIKGKNELFAARPRAIIGASLARTLSLNIHFLNPIKVNFPDKDVTPSLLNTADILKFDFIKATSIYTLSNEENSNRLIVPFDFLSKLIDTKPTQATKILCNVSDKSKVNTTQSTLERVLGNQYLVQNKEQQEEELYKLLNVEKIGIYFVLMLLIFIASYSIISSVIMLIINKKSDIKILTFLGLKHSDIKKIFFLNSLFIILCGAILGVFIGSAFTLLQEHFHFIKAGGIVIDYYPVDLRSFDLFVIFGLVFTIACVISVFPVKFLTKRFL